MNERVKYAKIAIENTREAYEFVEFAAYVPKTADSYLKFQLLNFQDFMTTCKLKIQNCFLWCPIGEDDIATAFAMCVNEALEEN